MKEGLIILKVILLAFFMACVSHFALSYFNVNGFLNGWLSATAYYAVIVLKISFK